MNWNGKPMFWGYASKPGSPVQAGLYLYDDIENSDHYTYFAPPSMATPGFLYHGHQIDSEHLLGMYPFVPKVFAFHLNFTAGTMTEVEDYPAVKLYEAAREIYTTNNFGPLMNFPIPGPAVNLKNGVLGFRYMDGHYIEASMTSLATTASALSSASNKLDWKTVPWV